MNKYLYCSAQPSPYLSMMLAEFENDQLQDIATAKSYKNAKFVFAIELNSIGVDIKVLEFLENLENDAFYGSDAIILINSESELFTKSFVQTMMYILNMKGCQFVGRPMVEAISNLKNMITPAKVNECTKEEALLKKTRLLRERFINFKFISKDNPKLLVVHSSNKATSNTLKLWQLVEKHLNMDISEIHIENNEIKDCNGCSYDVCSYFGKTNSCIFKGKIIDEVFPKLLESDGLVILSPNYNDSISAQLMAFINRLTSLFTQHDFYDKTLFSVIVSGYSGSDCLAKQLISAVSINKQFRLPPNFALTQIANEKGALLDNNNIEGIAKQFANNIKSNL